MKSSATERHEMIPGLVRSLGYPAAAQKALPDLEGPLAGVFQTLKNMTFDM